MSKINNPSLDSLIIALKQLSKRHDGHFYPPTCYYVFLRWTKLAKRGAIFKYDEGNDKMTWELPNSVNEKRLEMDRESNIVYESDNFVCYVYKVGHGHYEVRKNGVTTSVIIGNFDMPDEPSDSLARAKEMCDEESVK